MASLRDFFCSLVMLQRVLTSLAMELAALLVVLVRKLFLLKALSGRVGTYNSKAEGRAFPGCEYLALNNPDAYCPGRSGS